MNFCGWTLLCDQIIEPANIITVHVVPMKHFTRAGNSEAEFSELFKKV